MYLIIYTVGKITQITSTCQKADDPTSLRKSVAVPNTMSKQNTFKPRYMQTSYQTQLDFQGKAMIIMDPADKYSAPYLVVVQYEANRCVVSFKNTKGNMISFSPDNHSQTVVY